MSMQKPPLTPAEHLTRAEEELTAGDDSAARTHALLAIAGVPVDGAPYTDLRGANMLGANLKGAVRR